MAVGHPSANRAKLRQRRPLCNAKSMADPAQARVGLPDYPFRRALTSVKLPP
jgi:hypothetical protein